MIYRKNDDILLDILCGEVYENFVSINLHVSKLVHLMVNNILKLGPLHIAAESRSHTGGLICGSDFDSARRRPAVNKNGTGYAYIPSSLKTGGNHAGNK